MCKTCHRKIKINLVCNDYLLALFSILHEISFTLRKEIIQTIFKLNAHKESKGGTNLIFLSYVFFFLIVNYFIMKCFYSILFLLEYSFFFSFKFKFQQLSLSERCQHISYHHIPLDTTHDFFFKTIIHSSCVFLIKSRYLQKFAKKENTMMKKSQRPQT